MVLEWRLAEWRLRMPWVLPAVVPGLVGRGMRRSPRPGMFVPGMFVPWIPVGVWIWILTLWTRV
jgi:hypothetical protein